MVRTETSGRYATVISPAGVAGLNGQDVTVEMSRPQGMKTEQRAVFFTNGVLFGQHLAVKEVWQLPVPADRAQLKAQIAAVRAKMAEETLQTRVASSVLVISGKVLFSFADQPGTTPFLDASAFLGTNPER